MLVYVGAIVVLFLFGTMLTRAKLGDEGNLNSKQWPDRRRRRRADAGHVVVGADRRLSATTSCPTVRRCSAANTERVSDSIFDDYLLPFWALSFVLLAALVGAIVLAKRD